MLKVSLFLPMPSSSVSFPGENLDHDGPTTTAPIAPLSLPGGIVLEALASGGRLLFSGRFHFCACFHLVSSTLLRLRCPSVGGCMLCRLCLRWRILCRCVALADALPLPSLVGVHSELMLYRRCWSVGWMFCHIICVVDRRTFGVVSFSRLSGVWFWLGS